MAAESSKEMEWWKTYFTGLQLAVQSRIWTEEQTRAEATFVEQLLELPGQASVLDVPCGDGRLSIELASRGHRVTGVDLTAPLLEEAQHKATERRLEIAWEHRDMRDLPWHAEFDGAFCWWGSFGYFDDQGNAEFLQAVSRALKPGARFLVDTHVAETILPRFQARGWERIGDILVLAERRYDHVHSRLDAEITLVGAGHEEKKRSSLRMYTYRELCQLLEASGLTNWEGYGSLSREQFRLGSSRLYLVAVKRAKRVILGSL